MCEEVTLDLRLRNGYALGLEMDIRNLSFEPESFDIALDKGAIWLP